MQRKVKIMPKRKKTEKGNCPSCRSGFVVAGRCSACGILVKNTVIDVTFPKTTDEKTTASKKADQDSEREEPKSTDS